MKAERPSYQDQIKAAWNKQKKAKCAEGMVYYEQAMAFCACASFDTFKGSQAYLSWKETQFVKKEVERIEAGWKRFSYLSV